MIALPSWAPLAAALLFLVPTVWRSAVLRMRYGINPYVIDHSRPVERFLAYVFGAVTFTLFAYLAIAALQPVAAPHGAIAYAGIALMLAATVWTAYAQISMGTSWRIGVPSEGKTELKTHGPFSVSRNPVFLGMLAFVAGVALAAPNTLTVAALVASYISIEVQIRLEESYLESVHGDAYRAYRARVRRWI